MKAGDHLAALVLIARLLCADGLNESENEPSVFFSSLSELFQGKALVAVRKSNTVVGRS